MLKHILLVILPVLVLDQVSKFWIKLSYPISYHGQAIANWGPIKIQFIENPGMAFGWEFGGETGKLLLTCFRVVAVVAIGIYLFRLCKNTSTHKGYLVAMSLIFCGALGNIIDSAFYGVLFDKGMVFSDGQWRLYSGVADLSSFGQGYSGFMKGVVVDMIKFEAYWPEWMPFIGSNEVFPPIFNIADIAITCGVILMILRQKSFFQRT